MISKHNQDTAIWDYCLGQCSSKFTMHPNPLRVLLKCKFLHSRCVWGGARPRISHLFLMLRGPWPTPSSKGLEGRRSRGRCDTHLTLKGTRDPTLSASKGLSILVLSTSPVCQLPLVFAVPAVTFSALLEQLMLFRLQEGETTPGSLREIYLKATKLKS